MRVYSWIGGDRPSDVAKAAKEKQEVGFTAIKMNGTEELQMVDSYEKIDAVLERVASIREATGKYFGIAVDFHGPGPQAHGQDPGQKAGGIRSDVH